MPKISAVMALYNTPYNYLKATVRSILSQTFKDFELIIIDDASSMEYGQFFEQFEDERIKYIKLEKNKGPGYARNIGIKEAKGEYIAIVDSDDIYLPLRFEKQSDFLDKNPDIAVLGCAFRFSNKKNKAELIENDEDIKTFLLFNSPFANPSMMFRKNFFIENNLFYSEKINFGEDYNLWIDAVFAGAKTANLNDLLMIYTRRKNQLSKTKQNNQIMILKNIYKEMFKKMELSFSTEEIDLHYNIYSENFSSINDLKIIEDWFDKIITQNKNKKIFNEEKLLLKKEFYIKKFKKIKNRLLKIKVGKKNFCLSKNLYFYIEERD